MKLIGAAFHESGLKLNLKLWLNRGINHSPPAKFGNGVVRDSNQGAGYNAAIVVDFLNGKVIVAGTLSANRRPGSRADRTTGSDARLEKRKIEYAGTGGRIGKVGDLFTFKSLWLKAVSCRCQQ